MLDSYGLSIRKAHVLLTLFIEKEEDMIKKLFIGIFVFLMLVSFSWSGEVGQTCTVLKGNQVIQVFKGDGIQGVTVPKEHTAVVVGNISEKHLNFLNTATGTDWKDAVYLEFDFDVEGEILHLKILAKPEHLKDCK